MNELSSDEAFRSLPLCGIFEKFPLGFLDIGARGGVHEIVEPFAELTAVLGFEPDPEECREMLKEIDANGTPFANLDLEAAGLAAEIGEATLHRITAPTNDSLREPNRGYVDRYDMIKWHKIGELTVPVTTLDDVVFDRRGDDPHIGEIIKIDTQGTELEILRAGGRVLDERCVAIIAEVSFCELYEGQGRFSDLEIFLAEHGFVFYGFDLFRLRSCNKLDKRTHWSRERMIQADAVFLKDPLPGDRIEKPLGERQSACLLMAAVLLEYYEFAVELAESIYSSEDAKPVVEWILSIAELDLAGELSEMKNAVARAENKPEDTAIVSGGFVDRRRKRNDVAFWTSRMMSGS